MDHGLRLVTRNSRDFSEKKHPFALIPYRLG
jgi:predicted nucleic acid-binding protein